LFSNILIVFLKESRDPVIPNAKKKESVDNFSAGINQHKLTNYKRKRRPLKKAQ